MADTPVMKVRAVVPYYGAARMVAKEVGRLLQGRKHVSVPFAASMSEIPYIGAQTLLVNDLHRHVINLCRALADPALRERLAHRLKRWPFHPDVLLKSQQYAKNWVPTEEPDLWAAEAYFVSQWMGRSGLAGTKHEFTGGLPVRWVAGGGDSNVRYRSAVESIDAWGLQMERCNFTTLDYRTFFESIADDSRSGVYCDPPFPVGGAKYWHTFTPKDHRRLHRRVARFTKTRVVLRYYADPLIEELYDEEHWCWNRVPGRKSTNEKVSEVLITNILKGDR